MSIFQVVADYFGLFQMVISILM